jgi:hypothetical protein
LGKLAGKAIEVGDPDRIALSNSGVPQSFLKCLRNFLKEEYIPTEAYARENMIFARDVNLLGWGQPQGKGDVAYLPYRVDGRDFLIAQTFDGFSSSIGISISPKVGERFEPGRLDESKSILLKVWDAYFVPDAKAPVDLVVERSKGLNADLVSARRAENGKFNYRQTIKGTFHSTGICLVFMKLRYYPEGFKDMLPSWNPPAEKYFDWILGRYHAPRGSKKGTN